MSQQPGTPVAFSVTDEAACIAAFGDSDCQEHRHDNRYAVVQGGFAREVLADDPSATQRECRCCGFTEFL